MTFDDLAQMITQAHGVLLMLAGLGIMMGEKLMAPLLLAYTMVFLMVLQDNPLLVDYIKPAPKSKAYKWGDLTRHLSVIGASVLLMAAGPGEKEVDEDTYKKTN